ncbi:MAG: ATP-binding cassette domain-containing protein [Candidatus Omnitrophota bacterium]
MLEIKNLSVEVSGKLILKNIDLKVGTGEIMVLFGPNGSGKSTLIKTIMGFSGYIIKKGEIILNGEKINDMSIDERVKQGIGIMHQHPPKIRGVKLKHISSYLCNSEGRIDSLSKRLSLTEHMDRDLNVAFSGGEMKRSELFQVNLQNSDFLMMDEPESGVDLENISIMGKVLDEYLKQKGKSALIITHTGYILDYIATQKGCLLLNGKLWCSGKSAGDMFNEIKEKGYERCEECHGKKKFKQNSSG